MASAKMSSSRSVPEQAIAAGAERNEHLIVGAAEAAPAPFALQHADDRELHSADAHVLADDRLRIIDAELRRARRTPSTATRCAADVVGRREHAARDRCSKLRT